MEKLRFKPSIVLTKERAEIANRYFDSVRRYGYRDLSYCYNSYSSAKSHAESAIINDMNLVNGYGYTVISYNVMQFTCGFEYEREVVYSDVTYIFHGISYYTAYRSLDIEYAYEVIDNSTAEIIDEYIDARIEK